MRKIINDEDKSSYLREVPADKLKINLLPGFHLMEDTELTHSIRLFYGDQPVHDFSSNVDPAEIEKKAKAFLERIKWNKTPDGL